MTDIDEYGEYNQAEDAKIPISRYFADDATGPVMFVAAYEVQRQCGGPEEGGWWFDTGELVEVLTTAPEDVGAAIKHLQAKYPRTRRRYSVLGGADHDIMVYTSEFPPARFPEELPHYE